jgi:hypothetical protein
METLERNLDVTICRAHVQYNVGFWYESALAVRMGKIWEPWSSCFTLLL